MQQQRKNGLGGWARRLSIFTIILALWPIAAGAAPGSQFFAETGFSVSDDAQASFLTEFGRFGGVDTMGYPISRPYQVDGFRYQAFQRAILQWRPELGHALLANTLDWITDQSKDAWLDARGVPRPLKDSSSGWDQVVAERESWLQEPSIAQIYRNGGGMERFGLPQSRPERRGPFTVQRFQRIVFQLWLDSVPGMPTPGTVVGVLVGDMASQAGIIPSDTLDPQGAAPSGPPAAPPTADWLSYLNYLRGLANLPKVSENPSYSDGGMKHARYMVLNGAIGHTETPGAPGYTEAGVAAAKASNTMGSSSAGEPDSRAFDIWITGPFHALGILDPQLYQVGYGSYRQKGGQLQMAAALDVLRGRAPIPSSVEFPIMWPANGKTVPFRTMNGSETPNPTTSCPGYGPTIGLPITLQLGTGTITPAVTAYSLLQDGVPVESCAFDATSYINANAAQQDLGRGALRLRDAIVLLPRNVLTRGATYTASITANGTTYTWSFTVSQDAR